MHHPLDNPIWRALTTNLAHLALGNDRAKKFQPQVSPLCGIIDTRPESFDALAQLIPPGETASLALPLGYEHPPGWEVTMEVPLDQMVCESFQAPPPASNPAKLVPLGDEWIPQMVALAHLTKPGPFESRTKELGRFLGIIEDGKLMAMAGERMSVPGYREVSAVCAHPDAQGKGYGKQLMAAVTQRIIDEGDIPFLHVKGGNHTAIGLYKKLGFYRRWKGHYTFLQRLADPNTIYQGDTRSCTKIT